MSVHSISACIFDLDGVIVDTAHFHFLSWQRLANEIGIDFSAKDNEQLKGVSRKKSLELILKMGQQTRTEAEQAALCDRKNEWYKASIAGMGPQDILPGVKPFLDGLKSLGIPVGLATSSKNRVLLTTQIGLADFFDAAVDGNMIQNSKPHPEIFLMCAEHLGVDPKRAVVFEDAQAGVQAANAGGMTSIGVGKPEVLHEADHVIPGFANFEPATLFDLLKA